MDYDELAGLVERARQGDGEAFAQLYDIFAKPTYYIALRIVKNELDAEDVVQETMMKLHANLESIKDAQAIVSYVNTIATRLCLVVLSRNKPELIERDSEFALSNLIDENEEIIPEEYAEQKEQRDHIVSLISELSEAQRVVVVLYYYRQLPIKEIADTLEIDETAVKMRLSRARAILKEKLGDM